MIDPSVCVEYFPTFHLPLFAVGHTDVLILPDQQCAGFETAVDEAQRAIYAAYVEANAFPNCVSVVKLSKCRLQFLSLLLIPSCPLSYLQRTNHSSHYQWDATPGSSPVTPP